MIAKFLRGVIPERYRPIGYLTRLVRARTGARVRLGPFAGMHYIGTSAGSAYLPKLLGTYERELAQVIERACTRQPRLIVDVGAAEGYYAVGLALRCPHTRVVAFEREAAARAALLSMARLNCVQDRVEILGECIPSELERVLRAAHDVQDANPRCLVVCDVEGEEDLLLDVATVPSLRKAIILVETHEFAQRGITERLRRRFSSSHQIDCIWQDNRSLEDFPFRSPGTWLLPNSYLEWAVSEWRPERMCWLWMEPRN